MKRAVVFGTALLAIAGVAGCGENPTSPTTLQSPFQGQFGGTYSGATLLTGVNAGECVGADLRASGATLDQGTVSVAQTATDVTAIVRSSSTGLSCRYDGSAAFTSFALSAVSCDNAEIFFQCSNGNARVLNLVGSTMTVEQTGNTAAGLVTSTYNVSAVDSQGRRVPVAGLTLQHQFTALRR